MGLQWGGAGSTDALEDVPGFVTAVTNTSDPHAMIGNESRYGSVDAMIAMNAGINHFNAAVNKITPRPAMEAHYPVETNPAYQNQNDIKFWWPAKKPIVYIESEKAQKQALRENKTVMSYASFEGKPYLQITCSSEQEKQALLESLRREAKSNKVTIDFVEDEKDKKIIYVLPSEKIKDKFTGGVYVSANGELSLNLGNKTFRDFFKNKMQIAPVHAEMPSSEDAKIVGENAIYFHKTALPPENSHHFLATNVMASPAAEKKPGRIAMMFGFHSPGDSAAKTSSKSPTAAAAASAAASSSAASPETKASEDTHKTKKPGGQH
jgi:hypothetical protein